MPTAVANRALAEAERIARGKERRRDAMVDFYRAAGRMGVRAPAPALDALAAEVDAAAYWRALADGQPRAKAKIAAERARKRTRGLLS